MKVIEYTVTASEPNRLHVTAVLEGVDGNTGRALETLGSILRQATSDGRISGEEQVQIGFGILMIFSPSAQAQFGPLAMVIQQALADGKIDFIEWLIISGTLKSALSFRPAAAKTA